jgi:hypothetical protein
MATHATVQTAALAIDPDSQFPYRETPIWDLAAALQEQWANEQPADWSMVSEVLTRAVDAVQPRTGRYKADGTYVDTF